MRNLSLADRHTVLQFRTECPPANPESTRLIDHSRWAETVGRTFSL